MQHLLLAISIITLILIAGNSREKTPLENNKVSMEMEKPAINNKVKSDLPTDKPFVIFSRFEMFAY